MGGGICSFVEGNNHAFVSKVLVRNLRRFAVSAAGIGLQIWGIRGKKVNMQLIVHDRSFILCVLFTAGVELFRFTWFNRQFSFFRTGFLCVESWFSVRQF